MTNKDLANLMFPNIKLTAQDYEEMYPKRELDEKAIVTRYAPSPTGFVHMGNVYSAFIGRKAAKQTGGVFYLRIEDTDQKRFVEGGIECIIRDMKNFNIEFDECPYNMDETKGEYGPYIQSQRRDIYQAFVKHFVENDLAYPCFCSEETLDDIRKNQENRKERLGYYGRYAKCRHLSTQEVSEKINNGETFVVRLKSPGSFDKKMTFHDLVKGDVEMPENDMDIVILKTEGLPTYHFAHLVDDHLMRTTHIVRADEWFPSLPIHVQLFQMLGVKPPKFCHLTPVLKLEDGSLRKLSKRKDPEAAVSYYHEKGVPIEAVMIYIATISNTNFEAWYDNNKDKAIDEFEFNFNKISRSGALFDLEKLTNISKNYMCKLSASEVYERLFNWTEEFDKDFSELIDQYKEYTINVLNIEREQSKPRKDFAYYSDIKDSIWYMYDELFDSKIDLSLVNNAEDFKLIIKDYANDYYDIEDDKDNWFRKIKELAAKYSYASEMSDYKANPENYKGSIADISNMIRVAVTSKTTTPDLYEILKLLGKEKIISRIDKLCE